MDMVKSFSRRSLFWLLFFMLLLLAIIDLSAWLGAEYVTTAIPLDDIRAAAEQSPELRAGIDRVMPLLQWVRTLFLPVSITAFILFALLEWLVIRSVFTRTVRKGGMAGGEPKGQPEKGKPRKEAEAGAADPVAAKKALQEQHRRYYLHMLTVLQREGRLVDFLEEDLAAYDDAQIGAAVRSIHENCRKALDRYLSPKAVIDRNEGESFTVAKDFDPAVIKLIGNVTGEPPFAGVLRHRGWRAAKLELPVLSGSGDEKIIAPAEVEIP